MFLINKLVSWIVSPWRKKNGKSKENDAEKGNKGTAETEERNVKVNTTNNIGGSDKKETKKGWKYWLVIILLIVLIANVAALHVKVNNLSKLKPSNPQIQNPNDTDIEQKFRSIACVTMYGSQSTVLKDFPCVECLDFGQEFYNVTEFCILRSFWRNALNRTTFEQLRWLSDNNYCNWGGVTCNENKNVVELTFRAPFVPFAFTANLAKMTTLRKITILGNGAFPIGELPDVFFQLGNLEELSIVSTGYNGPIPSKVKPSGNVNLNLLVSLKKLEFFNNTQLNGTIPDEFSNLKELKELNLTDNKFSGPIPNSIGTIDINRLALSGNLLTGTVPDNICQRNYADGGCDLGRNQLTTQSCGKCNLT